MATEINGDWQPRYVRRIDLDVDGQRCHAASKSLRADAQFVDAHEQLSFELAKIGARMPHINRPYYRLLREQRGGLERPADANTDDDRRTRVGAGAIDRLEDEIGDRGDAISRNEHLQRAHVLSAESFRGEGDLHVRSEYQI